MPAAIAHDGLGEALLGQGRSAEAAAEFEAAAAILMKLGDEDMRAQARLSLSHALFAEGKVAEAKEAAEESLGALEAGNDELHKADAQTALARVVSKSEPARARRLLAAAIATFRSRGPSAAEHLAEAEALLGALR
jgi:tetratricopeptide (TPR) repeat protein